jgi:NAD(P)-binding Rossmann-like domain
MPESGSCVTRSSEAATHFEAIVLGAGISGLVSASVLAAQGYKSILIADTYSHVGGNHIDWSSGGYTFDAGSFIFQDDSPLLRHFPELLPRYTPIFPTWARLNPQGIVTAYPISLKDDVFATGLTGVVRIALSVLYARAFQREMRNAKDFARYWIGSSLLYSSGLESYMKRFYGVLPDEIDIRLAKKRMAWISEHASLKSLARRALQPKSKGPANQQLARPKEGFSHLYRAARERLERKGVTFVLGAETQRLDKEGKSFRLRIGDQTIASNRVISTIPINHLEVMCGIKSTALKTITLLSLFFSFSGKSGFSQSIIYNFSHDGAWKRLTMYSDFYGLVEGRQYFTAEVISGHIDNSINVAEENFRTHVRANGLFEGDLKLEGSLALDNAYPIYSEQSSERADDAISVLADFGIESFGRQGGFNYQPTARVSTIDAEIAMRRSVGR